MTVVELINILSNVPGKMEVLTDIKCGDEPEKDVYVELRENAVVFCVEDIGCGDC